LPFRVLVIDDEALIRRSLSRAFAARACEVHEAADGAEGLEKWKTLSPNLVVLDVLMPRMTGPQVLSRRGELPNAKVVLISAYTGEYDPSRAQAMGADLFIPKPFADIFLVVDSALQLLQDGKNQ
jgi:CheY-like chemotaxis protein